MIGLIAAAFRICKSIRPTPSQPQKERATIAESVRIADLVDLMKRLNDGKVQLTGCVKLTYISHQLSRARRPFDDSRDLPAATGDRDGADMGGGHEDISSCLPRAPGCRQSLHRPRRQGSRQWL